MKAFDSRIQLYPIEQTATFIEKAAVFDKKMFRQWEIYLEVMIEKRPKHDKAEEWKKALKMMEHIKDNSQ